MRLTVLILLCGLFLVPASPAQQETPSLMPLPASLQMGSGQLAIDPSFTVSLSGPPDARLERAVHRFLEQLRRQTGMVALDMKTVHEAGELAIQIDGVAREIPELGEDESYSLIVTSNGATLRAPTTLGAMHGLQTFLQLVRITPQGFATPAVSIQDKPRFPWRGLMIDSGRHFMPLDMIRRNLDGMEAVKLNVLHWHLSENQGFRVESKKFPKLQEMGSDGLFYTQAEIRDIIAYAADRGIRVMPEFDMPGHSTAWFVGYPELASAPGPYEIERHWGVFDPAMDPTKESTYKFLDTFIAEMAGLFPDKYFHIGGDEVNGKQWDGNPQIQQFLRTHNIKDNADLQAQFNTRVQKIVSKYGKLMMGWDEILRPDLPKNIVVQSWRGQESLADAVKQGYSGILSSGYYIDLMQPAASHYAVDPLSGAAASLSPEEQKRILGGETTMWAEWVSPENVDSRIWPRTAAIAERFWSPQSVTDVDSMYERMEVESRRLDWLDLTHNSSYLVMLRRMVGSDDIAALKTLADVSETVKGYSREELSPFPPTSLSPMNRLPDAVRVESMTARQFSLLTDQIVSGKMKLGTEVRIRSLLLRWRDNPIDLEPAAMRSSLVKEFMPLAHDLSALGSAGLQALDYLDRGERAPEDWKTEQLAMLEKIKKPTSQLELAVLPAIQKLVEAAANQPPVTP
ncbi:MAG: family 20 glycosylhydrolase [Acidobacteria bacterium]|nr:family 20 glycosylhydrolase [Acidobacteriota bacterium]